jgi:membrane-associated phospholipid phosphatase
VEPVWNVGISIISALQGLGNWLTPPMLALTFLGRAEFFFIFVPAVYWCVDAGLGLRVGIYLLSSVWLNETVKLVVHHPRPFWVSREVAALSTDSGFGLPSGHAQNSVVIWGLLASASQQRWAWAAAVMLTFVIGLSRVYLGVHFPTDVIAGWLIGVLLLWAFLRWEAQLQAWFVQRTPAQQIGAALAATAVPAMAGILSRLVQPYWQMPRDWSANSVAAIGAPLDPDRVDVTIAVAGIIFGMVAANGWLARRGGFRADGSLVRRLGRLALGVAGAGLIWGTLTVLTASVGMPWAYAMAYLRAAMLGVWVGGAAPELFMCLGLARRPAASVALQ